MENHPQKGQRLAYVDSLKMLGLFCIMLAHSDPPSWLFEVRNFDVPLMVILSSFLVGISYRSKPHKTAYDLSYVIKRILKLIIPTYSFLLFYFAVLYIRGYHYPADFYAFSFLLTSYGLGFVWVILIYIYSAALVPVYSSLNKKALCIIVTLYVIYELLYRFKAGTDNRFLMTTFYNIIPYGLLTFLGYIYPRLSPRSKKGIIVLSFAIYVICALSLYHYESLFVSTQQYKYPPRVYYLSYGIAVSFLLLYCDEQLPEHLFDNKYIRFVSRNSLWIYLWHILLLFILERSVIKDLWLAKLLVLIAGSSLIVVAQNHIVDLLQSLFPSLNILKYYKS